jgi:hypothetical protein
MAYSGEPPPWVGGIAAIAPPLPADYPRVIYPGVNDHD